jgi:hypothetical protein
MKLQELVELHGKRPEHSVPDWMLGFFKRYSISFANGMTDLKTHVCWLQSRNFSIDLRLPRDADQVVAKPLLEYSEDELQQVANYEGWLAASDWDGEILSWQEANASFQLHNRWTEPAILKRVGNCMVEFCPSDAYVEDWRLQPSSSGPLVGLNLIEERNLSTGEVRHSGGGLIVCGDYAGLVLGRGPEFFNKVPGATLKSLVANASGDIGLLTSLLNFETSVAKGSVQQGFNVIHSTQASRMGQDLFCLEGFEYITQYQYVNSAVMDVVRQKLTVAGVHCERIFSIDTLESHVDFSQSTAFTHEAESWFERESPTMSRYTKVLC